ncbi:MMPL family transporter [Virgisporangium aurantiacum]|uniref:Membrane protein n=1 Tax=Virgisporangium aurantiacum TaxID=175570 RepID=A0A8J4E562_9ACTN|nr:MMPL family transporter [Virgisporangium aurantiacum]GIJ61946.1 membrane protein [Virgisporangium aurantiacum]
MERRPVTVRMARWSATHPWRAMAMWVVFVVLCFGVGGAVGLKEAEDDLGIGEAGRAEQLYDQANFDDPAVENVIVTARAGQLDQAAATKAADDAVKKFTGRTDVAKVEGPIPAPNGSALLVKITMTGDPETATDRVEALRAVTAEVQAANPAVRVEETGGPSINKALDETLGEDFKKAEFLSLPVTIVILVIAFGALIAAGVPLLLAISSVIGAMGLSTLASHLIPATDTTNSVILLIGMAVGVDYSLFYVRREREEKAKGRAHLDAVEIAAATSGHAVVVSAIAVMISMAGLFLAQDTVFSSLAVGSILVVAVAMLGSLTVLPAMLAKMGRWLDKGRIPVLWKLTNRQGPPRFWPALLKPALKYPLVTLLISAGALVALAIPALDMKMKFPGDEDLPRDTAAMQAYDRLTAAFPSTGTSHMIVVKASPNDAAAVQNALDALVAKAATDPEFAVGEKPEVKVSADKRIAVIDLPVPFHGGSPQAEHSLETLRNDLVPATVGAVPGAEYAVGGFVAASVDYADHIRSKLPLVMAFVLFLTFFVMVVTFRSVVVALTSILLNLLSAAASYGLLVLVFQGSWAEGILGFHSMDAVVTWLPLFLFVVLFGLSMDYHVFVVSRIREAVLGGMSTKDAVAHGITTSAGTVTSAAMVMVGVFSIFATLSTIDMKQLGVGLAAAILIDATVIRAVVLPSVMTALGKANWWAPKFMRPKSAPRHAAPESDERVLERV